MLSWRRQRTYLVIVIASVGAVAAACVGEDPVSPRNGVPEAGADAGADADTGAGQVISDAMSDAGTDGAGDDGARPPADAGPRVACTGGTTACPVPSAMCCDELDGGGACKAESNCTALAGRMLCDSKDDCPEGQFCCANTIDGFQLNSFCGASCSELVLCRSLADCPGGSVQCTAPQPEFRPLRYTICR